MVASTLSLGFFFLLAAVVGGGFVARFSLSLPSFLYLEYVLDSTEHLDVTLFVLKIAVFGLLIAGVAAVRGLQVERSAEAIPRAVSDSTIQSVGGCVLVDAFFGVLFYLAPPALRREPSTRVREPRSRWFRALDGSRPRGRAGRDLRRARPNGCGKSTFLRLCIGLVTPTSGTVSLFGQRLDRTRRAPPGTPSTSGGLRLPGERAVGLAHSARESRATHWPTPAACVQGNDVHALTSASSWSDSVRSATPKRSPPSSPWETVSAPRWHERSCLGRSCSSWTTRPVDSTRCRPTRRSR